MELKIEGLEDLRKAFKKEGERLKGTDQEVGYTANYAIYVHENLNATHNNGQSKFLEEPLRTNSSQYVKLVEDLLKQGRTFEQALAILSLRVKRDSQQLVPVDTGNLKGSAFTRKVS